MLHPRHLSLSCIPDISQILLARANLMRQGLSDVQLLVDDCLASSLQESSFDIWHDKVLAEAIERQAEHKDAPLDLPQATTAGPYRRITATCCCACCLRVSPCILLFFTTFFSSSPRFALLHFDRVPACHLCCCRTIMCICLLNFFSSSKYGPEHAHVHSSSTIRACHLIFVALLLRRLRIPLSCALVGNFRRDMPRK